MRLTCAVPYLATSAISPSTIAGRALSASIRTASLSWAMTKSVGEDEPMVALLRLICRSPLVGDALRSGSGTKASPASGLLPVPGGRLFLIRAVAAQALVALGQQVGQRHRFQLVELVQQHGLQADRHRTRIAVGAAERLAHQLVDQAQFQQARGSHAQASAASFTLSGL